MDFILTLSCGIVLKIRPEDEILTKIFSWRGLRLHCLSLQRRKKSNPRFPRTITYLDRKIEETYFKYYIFCLRWKKKGPTMSNKKYLRLNTDNSNSCNCNFTMCCLSNVNKSFCWMCIPCFLFNPQLELKYLMNIGTLKPTWRSIHFLIYSN